MQSPRSASGDPGAGPVAPLSDGRTFLPSLLGFHKSQVLGQPVEVANFTRGYSLFRVKAGDFNVSALIGLASLPTDWSGFVRSLTVTIRDGDSNAFLGGIVNQGMPLHPLSYSCGNGIRRRYLNEDTVCYLQMADLVSEAILGGLAMHANLKGCTLNPKQALEFFGDGRLDCLLGDLFRTDLETALRRCDPNSLEWVSDLNYQVGLGILDLEPLSGCVHPDDLPHEEDDRDDDLGLSQLLSALGNRSWASMLGSDILHYERLYPGLTTVVGLITGRKRLRYAHLNCFGELLELSHENLSPAPPAFYFRPALKGHIIPFCPLRVGGIPYSSSGTIISGPDIPTLSGLDYAQDYAWAKHSAIGTVESGYNPDVR